jgi:hypothetical protein
MKEVKNVAPYIEIQRAFKISKRFSVYKQLERMVYTRRNLYLRENQAKLLVLNEYPTLGGVSLKSPFYTLKVYIKHLKVRRGQKKTFSSYRVGSI